MGLLDKTNKKATIKSLTVHTILGGIGAAILWTSMRYTKTPGLPSWTLLIAIVGGQLIAWLVEWQTDAC